MRARSSATAPPACTSSSTWTPSRACRSTRRTACTARPATSRTRRRTSSGSPPKAAAARTTRTCSRGHRYWALVHRDGARRHRLASEAPRLLLPCGRCDSCHVRHAGGRPDDLRPAAPLTCMANLNCFVALGLFMGTIVSIVFGSTLATAIYLLRLQDVPGMDLVVGNAHIVLFSLVLIGLALYWRKYGFSPRVVRSDRTTRFAI